MKQDYIEFQNRSKPVAYFISIRSYGTWLHGDERGSVNRQNHNIFGTAKMPTSPNLQKHETFLLKHRSVKLNAQKRSIIENAIREVCEYRNYKLFAIQARTNHVHIVVFGDEKPEVIMNSFKAYSTRRLREKNFFASDTKVWSRHGSTRYLWTEKHIETAIDYVINGQGDELPEF